MTERGNPVRHAFVIDDDAMINSQICDCLASEDFTPHPFANGGEIEAALAQYAPVLMVLDLSLGDSDAVEVLRLLATLGFEGQILLISGLREQTLQQVQAIGERRGLNMLPPLPKPFMPVELRRRTAMIEWSDEENTNADRLREAILNKRLELWYQPKVNLQTMTMRGAEALARVRQPSGGMLQPADFLPKSGDSLYFSLTDFVVQRALADWSIFSGMGPVHRLSVNVPASALQRPSFVSTLRNNLPRSPAFPGLIVEITENEAINDPELAREVAVQLGLYDVHVSIDDFGQGYSSIERLSSLPFVEIKLDRQFVMGCADDARKRSMCAAVLRLANRFKIEAIAEGIETIEDLRVLKEIGYTMGQGYLLARPMPASELGRLLTRQAS